MHFESLIGGYGDYAEKYPLHQYQQRAAEFLVNRLFVQDEMGAGLFLDPGLGKTRTTLAVIDLLEKLGAARKTLILAPLRPLYAVWPEERRLWGFPQLTQILHGQVGPGLAYDRPIELMNFGSMKKLVDLRNRWDLLVIDESTYVKNWTSQRMKHLKKIIKTIPKRIILTGTPAANSLQDLFAQMYIVDGGAALGRTVSAFRAEYCERGGFQGRQWLMKRGKTKPIYEAIGDKVLRMQAEDYLDMPELVQNNVYVDLPERKKAQYRRFERELIAELESGEMSVTSAASAYAKCRQLACGTIYEINEDGERIVNRKSIIGHRYTVEHAEKIQAMAELAESVNGKPVLVFYDFKHQYAELFAKYRKAGFIQGGMKTSDVESIVKNWNEDKYDFLFCQWKAASHGLNLQKGSCCDIVCLSLTDSPETYEQAIRRIYRQGVKSKQIRIHRVIAKGTVEEIQLERLEGKHATQKEFLDALKSQAIQHTTRKTRKAVK